MPEGRTRGQGRTLRSARALRAAGLIDAVAEAGAQAVGARYAISVTAHVARLIDPRDPDFLQRGVFACYRPVDADDDVAIDTAADLPGQTPVIWRRTRAAIPLAALAGVMWPPLILTLLVWPPQNWLPGREIDWRLTVLVIGLVAVPAGLEARVMPTELVPAPANRRRWLLPLALAASALIAVGSVTLTVSRPLSPVAEAERAATQVEERGKTTQGSSALNTLGYVDDEDGLSDAEWQRLSDLGYLADDGRRERDERQRVVHG
jgi:hypothetical protein